MYICSNSASTSYNRSGCRLQPLDRPLIDAAKAGDIDTVKRLISQKHNINEEDHGGWTPFLKACEHGHLAIAQLLVENGASVHQESAFGWTALMQAAAGGHVDVAEWLIKQGVAVDKCQKGDGVTALWNAVSHGHVNCCELLVKAGASLTHVNKESTPMLIQAAYMGHIDVVAYLIAQGADPLKTIDKNYGNTLFLTACRWSHLPLVEWIMKNVKGVDVNQSDHYGNHAMNGAVGTHNLALAKRLVEFGWKVPEDPHHSPLIGCLDLDLAKWLVETLKVPLNVCSSFGSSALGTAAYHGKLELVKYLVSQGADINYKGSPEADTPLQTANLAKGDPKVDEAIAYLESLKPI